MHGQQATDRPSSPRTYEKGNTHELISGEDLKEYSAHLLRFSQTLCGQRKGVVNLLCQEVARIFQGRLQLLPRRDEAAISVAYTLSFPVHYRGRCYGALLFLCDVPVLQRLIITDILDFVRDCGWIVSMLEQCVLPHEGGRVCDSQGSSNLSKQEARILKLMVQGYTEGSIAQALGITVETVSKHRHTLYGKLGVHNSHDAILAGYHALCFSPLEDLTPCVAGTGYEIQCRPVTARSLPPMLMQTREGTL
jgi:DNA-binding CsgD family transcriptional regulator